MRIRLPLLLPLPLLFSCATASHGEAVRLVASSELGCAEDSLRIIDAEQGVYLIEGCGRSATFYCTDTRALQTRCERVTDPQQVVAEHSQLAQDGLDGRPPQADKPGSADAAAKRGNGGPPHDDGPPEAGSQLDRGPEASPPDPSVE